MKAILIAAAISISTQVAFADITRTPIQNAEVLLKISELGSTERFLIWILRWNGFHALSRSISHQEILADPGEQNAMMRAPLLKKYLSLNELKYS